MQRASEVGGEVGVPGATGALVGAGQGMQLTPLYVLQLLVVGQVGV